MGGIFGKKKGPPSEVFINFKDAKPLDGASLALYDELVAFLQTGEQLSIEISNYQGCQEAIKNSMSHPKDAGVQRQSFTALFENVAMSKRAYDYSMELQVKLPVLVLRLSKIVAENKQNLENEEALVKCLADVLDQSLRFDKAKMMNSGVQNDFAHYRRNMSNHRDIENLPVSEAGTNQVSMFLAVPNPMLKTCSDIISTLLRENPQVAALIAELANLCCAIVMTGKAEEMGMLDYCLNVMTASIVTFDVTAPMGVFKRNSGVDIKQCVQQLVKYKKTGLINNLKYSTKTYKRDSTPNSIRSLIEGE
eukprot:g1467.t1